jgi:hypothetical protein
MLREILEFEGTWEEILARTAELAGRRVRLQVLPPEEENHVRRGVKPNEGMLSAMRQVDVIQQGMHPRPGGDTQAYIREARAGAMAPSAVVRCLTP